MNFLFFDQPEMFYTINFYPGIMYGSISLTLIIGCALLFFVSLAVLLKEKIKFVRKNFNGIIISLFVVFWVPSAINFFYNNFYDFLENLERRHYSVSAKRILRFCDLENRGGGSGAVCQMFSFIKFAENNLPANAKVKILTVNSMLKNFFYYYLTPRFNITENIDDADFILSYDYSKITFNEKNKNYLVITDNENGASKTLVLFKSLGSSRLILK